MPKDNTGVRQKIHTDIKEPRKFKVIMHNDDVTTMDFVVEVLMTIFHKPQAEAERLMLTVDSQGSAVVGIYSLDIAETKRQRTENMARKQGFPLRLTLQPE